MPGTGLPCSVPQCGEATGKFHVQALPVSDIDDLGEKGAAAPLRHVWNAHVSGVDHQSPPDGKMQMEYAYEVEATGCGDSRKMCWGNLQLHGG